MDDQNTAQNMPPTPPPIGTPQSGGSFMNRKTIFIILGVVILVEVIWAGWSLLQLNQAATVTPGPTTSSAAQTATASLLADKTTLKVGESTLVTLNISSSAKSDGVDLIVSFDPTLLLVDATSSAMPVKTGTIFTDYPQNKIDTPGKVVVSGITDLSGGVLANGVFGTITFKALRAGSAKVSLEYKAGSTSDSNVIETGSGKDILNQVSDVSLRITP